MDLMATAMQQQGMQEQKQKMELLERASAKPSLIQGSGFETIQPDGVGPPQRLPIEVNPEGVWTPGGDPAAAAALGLPESRQGLIETEYDRRAAEQKAGWDREDVLRKENLRAQNVAYQQQRRVDLEKMKADLMGLQVKLYGQALDPETMKVRSKAIQTEIDRINEELYPDGGGDNKTIDRPDRPGVTSNYEDVRSKWLGR
jgi:hypothetical protein